LTVRRLAQKQPSFKESVIAHSSKDSAPQIIGAKSNTEDEGVLKKLGFLLEAELPKTR
jgi:hypothetical protein